MNADKLKVIHDLMDVGVKLMGGGASMNELLHCSGYIVEERLTVVDIQLDVGTIHLDVESPKLRCKVEYIEDGEEASCMIWVSPNEDITMGGSRWTAEY